VDRLLASVVARLRVRQQYLGPVNNISN
jgi:hypothetical protein